jgi:hypothetical protein
MIQTLTLKNICRARFAETMVSLRREEKLKLYLFFSGRVCKLITLLEQLIGNAREALNVLVPTLVCLASLQTEMYILDYTKRRKMKLIGIVRQQMQKIGDAKRASTTAWRRMQTKVSMEQAPGCSP